MFRVRFLFIRYKLLFLVRYVRSTVMNRLTTSRKLVDKQRTHCTRERFPITKIYLSSSSTIIQQHHRLKLVAQRGYAVVDKSARLYSEIPMFPHLKVHICRNDEEQCESHYSDSMLFRQIIPGFFYNNLRSMERWYKGAHNISTVITTSQYSNKS